MRKKYLTGEIRVWWSLGLIPLLMGVMTLSAAAVYFLNVRQAAACAETYREGLSLYEEDPEGLEEDLETESSVESAGRDGLLLIENPIRCYRDMAEHSVYSCRPGYSGWLACESACFFFPVIWGLFGVLCSRADGRDHVMKLRAARSGKRLYALRHLVSAAAVCAAGIPFYRGLFAVLSSCAGIYLKTAVPDWEDFLPRDISASAGEDFLSRDISASAEEDFLHRDTFAAAEEELLMMGILLLTALIFTAAGMLLGSLFQSALPGGILILLYALLPVSSGAWDVMNAVSDIVCKLCPFWGVFQPGDVISVSSWFRAGILGIWLAVPAVLYYAAVSRRSGYR